jgi:hypothetical protein
MDRQPGGDRNRNRDENREPEAAPAVRNESPAPARSEPAMAPLAPRRPLPAAMEPEDRGPSTAAPETEAAGESLFGSDDVQHGRRNQLKKKPRFELNEEEVKAAAEG